MNIVQSVEQGLFIVKDVRYALFAGGVLVDKKDDRRDIVNFSRVETRLVSPRVDSFQQYEYRERFAKPVQRNSGYGDAREIYNGLKSRNLKSREVDVDGVNSVKLFCADINFEEGMIRQLVAGLGYVHSFVSTSNLWDLPFETIEYYHDGNRGVFYLRVRGDYSRVFSDPRNYFLLVLKNICDNVSRKKEGYRIYYLVDGLEERSWEKQ